MSHRPIAFKQLRKATRAVRKLRNSPPTIAIYAVCRGCGRDAYMAPDRTCARCIGEALRALATGATKKPVRKLNVPRKKAT